MSKRVLVEYVKEHEASAGLVTEDDKAFTIEEGTRRYVDKASAASLVKRKIAKVITAEDLKAESEKEAKATSGKVEAPKPAEGAN